MIDALPRLFDTAQLLPHGLCLEWRPELVWLHAVSDGLTALAYYSIPFALLVFAYRRRDLKYRWMFLLFGAFILACGTTHLIGVWTLWQPIYGIQGVAKAATALTSVVTALLLWPLIPKALALPGPTQWRAVNDTLANEVAERRAAEEQVRRMNRELEARVRLRTAELEEANRALKAEIAHGVAAEAALRAAKEEAEAARAEAERASHAKSTFLAAASHDLRQPMQALFLFADTIELRLRGRPEQRVMDDFRRSLEALRSLLDSLLDISKLDAGLVRPQPVGFPLADVLDRLAAEYRPLAEAKGVELRVVGSTAQVCSDPTLLGRILQNLVHNAVRYTERGRILVGCRRRRAAIEIMVRDTGIGIADKHAEDVFAEFFQIDNDARDREKGLGLGLAIVRRLSRLLGHDVRLCSRPGAGATFTVSVPLAAAPSRLRTGFA